MSSQIETSTILMPAAVAQDVRGEIPGIPYLLHFVSAKIHTKAETGNNNIEAVAEIVAPDVVQNEKGENVNVAGQKITAYIPITPSAGNFNNAFLYLGKLQMLEANGGFQPDKVMKELNTGTVFFTAFAFSEPNVLRHPVTKQPVMVNGQEVKSGYRPCLLDHSHILARSAPPAGWTAPTF